MRVRLLVRLTPRGGRDAVEGFDLGGTLRVRVAAAPVDGAANAALMRLLAKQLGIGRSSVQLVAGGQSRVKTIEVEGLSDEEIRDRLSGAGGGS